MSTLENQVKEVKRLVKAVEDIEQTLQNISMTVGPHLREEPMIRSHTTTTEIDTIVRIGVDVVKFIREVTDEPKLWFIYGMREFDYANKLLTELLGIPETSLNSEGGCFLGVGGDVSIADEVGEYSDATEHHLEPVIRGKLVLLRAIQTVFEQEESNRELIKRIQSLTISMGKGTKGEQDGLADITPDLAYLIIEHLNNIPISDDVSARVDPGGVERTGHVDGAAAAADARKNRVSSLSQGGGAKEGWRRRPVKTRKVNKIPISDGVSATRVDQGKLRKKRKKKSKKNKSMKKK